MFQDRVEAAGQLARALDAWRGKNALVVAIPRGAVPMGSIIARALDAEFDIVMTRKLHAPGNPEFAIGAVDETGWIYLAGFARTIGATQAYLDAQVAAELEKMRERRATWTPGRAPISPEGRIVIVVDDGMATGSTMIAALHALRAKNPQRLVCAVPVATQEAVDNVGRYADDVVCLEVPERFYAVSQFYRQFPQVEDAEVIAVLNAAGTPPPGGT